MKNNTLSKKGYFYLDRVKSYLDKVLTDEEYLTSFQKVAEDICRVYSYKPRVNLQDVDSYLRGLPLGVACMTYETEKLAKEWVKAENVSFLLRGSRTMDDLYWWALSGCIWTFGAVRCENPQFKGGR